jgi:hypothetical protein
MFVRDRLAGAPDATVDPVTGNSLFPDVLERTLLAKTAKVRV